MPPADRTDRSAPATPSNGSNHPARDRAAAAGLVAGQGALLAVLVLAPRRHDWPTPALLRGAAVCGQVAGLAVAGAAAAGLGRGLTASPLPNPDAQLRTGGLYRHVRHPIYAGLLFAAASRTAASGNRGDAAALAALGGWLTMKARFEERALHARFPGYADYAQATPRFAPSLLCRTRRAQVRPSPAPGAGKGPR